MEPEAHELDMHDIIFKTIYLFLESNDLQETARSFLHEVKLKFKQDIDLQDTHARTLILRPLNDTTNASSANCFADNFIVNIPGYDYAPKSLQPNKRRTVIFRSKPRIPSETEMCSSCACANKIVALPHPRCPDCRRIAQTREEYEKYHDLAVTVVEDNSEAFCNWSDYKKLGDSIKDLQDNHVTLIHMASEITNAITKLTAEAKDLILSRYHKQIYNLYSYPGTHNSLDAIIMRDREDNLEIDNATESQVECAAICGSPHGSSSFKELFIPLESKQVVGDIPTLIGGLSDNARPLPVDSTTTRTTDKFESTSTMPEISEFNASEQDVAKECARNYPPNKSATLPKLNEDKMAPEASTSKCRSASILDGNHPSDRSLHKSMNSVIHVDKEKPETCVKASKRGVFDQRDAIVATVTEITTTIEEIFDRRLDPPQESIEVMQPLKQKSQHNLESVHKTDDVIGKMSKPVRKSNVYKLNDKLDLDWMLIKKDLCDGDINVKLKLIQALRWRLTKSNSEQRDKQLMEYVKHDILSINSIPPYGQLFLESFYCPTKVASYKALQEEIARFINTFASMAMGRLYLERDESLLSVMLLPLLMGKLPGVTVYDLTREFTMATVQKLSLSNKMREVIIAAGTVEWLINSIEQNHSEMSPYEAEYSIALLTNLCINKEARIRCERIAERAVNVIFILLETPHKCCTYYINPILYSLLLNATINERAVARGVGIKLKKLHLMFGDNDELKRQLDAIIYMHETHDFCECEDCEASEEIGNQNYSDYLEPELNDGDVLYGVPEGEDFLKTYQISDVIGHLQEEKTTSELIKRLSSVQIVKKTSVNPNGLKIDENTNVNGKTSNMTARQQRVSRKSSKPQPSRPGMESTKASVKNDKLAASVYNPKQAKTTGARRRAASQPPISRVKPPGRAEIPPPRKSNGNVATQPQKVKKYIVNCCYKMDYTQAIEAPPGEYVPYALDTAHHRPEACNCYEDIKQFVDGIAEPADEKCCNMTVQCTNCKHTISVIQIPDKTFMCQNGPEASCNVSKMRRKRVPNGIESEVIEVYEPKTKR